MGLLPSGSDYGSGCTINSSTLWGSQELDWETFQSQLLNKEKPRPTYNSLNDLSKGRCTIKDVMQEFRMNGFDSPYNPEDDLWMPSYDIVPPRNPANVCLRQNSWPADRTPSQRLSRPMSWHLSTSTSMPAFTPPNAPAAVDPNMTTALVPASEGLTEEQRRVLNSLPDTVVVAVLRDMRRKTKPRVEECRFCKNNGERETYYRSHILKDALGRVCCPVLRAFICKRCGARGDNAHTIKYCPMSTSEERIKSAAMMRSVRMASGRRRYKQPGGGAENYVMFGETPASVMQDSNAFAMYQERAPLDPLWAALEQKLML